MAKEEVVMDFDEVKEDLLEAAENLVAELKGKDTGAARKRIRKLTLDITKVGKNYRYLSTK